ncbi:MAG: AMP-binding protein [Microthrixaceae bacterium]
MSEAVGSSEGGFNGMRVLSADSDLEPPDDTGGLLTVAPGPNTLVIDDDNVPVEPGEIGRLARGGNVPIGYYKDPAKSAATFIEVQGARHSVPGDLARVELDGTITLLGRGSQCINSGGEKIYPEEVESVLKAHPSVFDALVLGMDDERWGQRVTALVQPRPGEEPTPSRNWWSSPGAGWPATAGPTGAAPHRRDAAPTERQTRLQDRSFTDPGLRQQPTVRKLRGSHMTMTENNQTAVGADRYTIISADCHAGESQGLPRIPRSGVPGRLRRLAR